MKGKTRSMIKRLERLEAKPVQDIWDVEVTIPELRKELFARYQNGHKLARRLFVDVI